MTVDVIIPTCNPSEDFSLLLGSLQRQTVMPRKVYILNTITDNCNVSSFNARYRIADNIEIRHLESAEFDHGKTRNEGARLSDADFVLFLTQDAVPADNKLIEQLSKNINENVVVAFARQISSNQLPIERLQRAFNYPAKSYIKSEKDKKSMGIKTIFCSNVCAMYHRKTFWDLDGFNTKNIFNEDMLFAYKAIKAGYSIAYEANACVIHSHNYSCLKIFRRYFDQGVSQKENEHIFKEFSSLGEGSKQAQFVIKGLWANKDIANIILFLFQSASKLSGFFFGRHYTWIPKGLCKKLSMNAKYFD